MLSNLDPSILSVILNPPQNAYAALKAKGQLKKLLGGLELGDEKPSHLLQKMKGLAGTKVSTEVLRTLFLDRLPEKTRCILVVADTTDLDKLANIADKICEQFTQSYSISELTSKRQPYIPTRSVDSDIGSKLNVILHNFTNVKKHLTRPENARNLENGKIQVFAGTTGGSLIKQVSAFNHATPINEKTNSII